MKDLIIQGGAVPTFLIDRCIGATKANAAQPCPPKAVRIKNASPSIEFDTEVAPLLANEQLDWAFVRSDLKLTDFGLIAFDMDSTLITIECIDELADFAGKKKEVAAVTEAAMRGEIDYSESLRQRLKHLAGLDARIFARVYSERLQLSPGVTELLTTVQAAGLRTAVLSGGFTYFTERLRIELGLDFVTSNELEIAGGKLTGRVIGEVVDGAAKARHLRRLRDELQLSKSQLIAVGDGANDLPMLAEAGLSIAYKAKPAIHNQADVALNHSGLNGILKLFN